MFNLFLRVPWTLRHEKMPGRAATGYGNFDGLKKLYACITEFFTYTLQKFEILWKFYLYFTNCSFRCTFEAFYRYFHWQTTQNCGKLKLSICGNFKFPRNASVEGIGHFFLPILCEKLIRLDSKSNYMPKIYHNIKFVWTLGILKPVHVQDVLKCLLIGFFSLNTLSWNFVVLYGRDVSYNKGGAFEYTRLSAPKPSI